MNSVQNSVQPLSGNHHLKEDSLHKKILVNLFVFAMLCPVLLVSCCGAEQSAQNNDSTGAADDIGYPEISVRYSHVATENTPKGQAAMVFKNYVEEKSGGKIKVDVFPSGQLW